MLLEQSPIELDASQSEELSIYLAEKREEVLIALQAKKIKPAKSSKLKADDSAVDKPEPLLKEAS